MAMNTYATLEIIKHCVSSAVSVVSSTQHEVKGKGSLCCKATSEAKLEFT